MSSFAQTILLLGVSGGVVALALFVLAYAKGAFDDPEVQALQIFDQFDLRYDRPWETQTQKAEREVVHGSLLLPRDGEWGGAK